MNFALLEIEHRMSFSVLDIQHRISCAPHLP